MALLARLCWKKVSETQAGIEPTNQTEQTKTKQKFIKLYYLDIVHFVKGLFLFVLSDIVWV